MGAALVLSGIVSGFIAAGFERDGSDTNVVRGWERASLVATVFFAFLIGGYVAGRMAGRSGVKHGLMVPLLALAITLLLTLFGVLVGASLVDNLSGVTLPELPRGTQQSLDAVFSASGIVALVFVPFVGGAFGGAWGASSERRLLREGNKDGPGCEPGSS
jgi:MFS family permease